MRRIVGFISLPRFDKTFRKLNTGIKDAFIERRRLLLADPNNPLLGIHKLHGEYSGLWSMNVTGDVRAVFMTEGYFAVFFDIGTHSELYDA